MLVPLTRARLAMLRSWFLPERPGPLVAQHVLATGPASRGLGLSTACAAEVVRDVRRRGRVPTWTTSPDNTASLRVAAKLGFALRRRDRLLVVAIPAPRPARRAGG